MHRVDEKNKKTSLEIFKVLFLSAIIILIGIFFMSKKENLDIDEVYTYGLANSHFQLDVEDFKKYSGEELLINYASPNDEYAFNVSNVFFNQSMDTHPPIYYIIINFICSIMEGSFSIWYGLIVNLIFMVILYHQTSYLLNKIIKDKIVSSVITLISFFTYGFINEFVFTRMYVMLSVLSLAFIILIVNRMEDDKIYNKLDFLFFVKFFLICEIGILTQYHFIFVAFFYSLVYGIWLLYRMMNNTIERQIKKSYLKELIMAIISGILSIAVSFIIFPSMIKHIFGSGSLHSIYGSATLDIVVRFTEMIKTVYDAFFGVGLYPYIILLIFAIIFVAAKSDVKKQGVYNVLSNNKLYFLFLLFSIYYYVVISTTLKFTFMRYLYNVYPIIMIVLIAPIYILCSKIKPMLKYLSIVVMIVFAISTTYNNTPFSLNSGDNMFYEYLTKNAYKPCVCLYRTTDQDGNFSTMSGTSSWKLPRPLYSFRSLESIYFVDISKYDNQLPADLVEDDSIFLVIYTNENDEKIINSLIDKYNYTSCERVYFNNYYHMYNIVK